MLPASDSRSQLLPCDWDLTKRGGPLILQCLSFQLTCRLTQAATPETSRDLRPLMHQLRRQIKFDHDEKEWKGKDCKTCRQLWKSPWDSLRVWGFNLWYNLRATFSRTAFERSSSRQGSWWKARSHDSFSEPKKLIRQMHICSKL